MIAFLPLWILGVPLVLALIDLIATRPGASDLDHYSPVVARPMRAAARANIS